MWSSLDERAVCLDQGLPAGNSRWRQAHPLPLSLHVMRSRARTGLIAQRQMLRRAVHFSPIIYSCHCHAPPSRAPACLCHPCALLTLALSFLPPLSSPTPPLSHLARLLTHGVTCEFMSSSSSLPPPPPPPCLSDRSTLPHHGVACCCPPAWLKCTCWREWC